MISKEGGFPEIIDFDSFPEKFENEAARFELHRQIWIEGFKAGFRYPEVPMADDLPDHAALVHYQRREIAP
jgi:hypothetical protein